MAYGSRNTLILSMKIHLASFVDINTIICSVRRHHSFEFTAAICI